MVNEIYLEGYVLEDLSHRVFDNSTLAKLTLKVPASKKIQGQWVYNYSFFDVDIWNPEESVMDIARGDRVYLSGRLIQERWERDGQKYSKAKVVATSLARTGKFVQDNLTANSNESDDNLAITTEMV